MFFMYVHNRIQILATHSKKPNTWNVNIAIQDYSKKLSFPFPGHLGIILSSVCTNGFYINYSLWTWVPINLEIRMLEQNFSSFAESWTCWNLIRIIDFNMQSLFHWFSWFFWTQNVIKTKLSENLNFLFSFCVFLVQKCFNKLFWLQKKLGHPHKDVPNVQTVILSPEICSLFSLGETPKQTTIPSLFSFFYHLLSFQEQVHNS